MSWHGGILTKLTLPGLTSSSREKRTPQLKDSASSHFGQQQFRAISYKSSQVLRRGWCHGYVSRGVQDCKAEDGLLEGQLTARGGLQCIQALEGLFPEDGRFVFLEFQTRRCKRPSWTGLGRNWPKQPGGFEGLGVEALLEWLKSVQGSLGAASVFLLLDFTKKRWIDLQVL